MEKTQLQLRIETAVSTNKSYPVNSYFIDMHGYSRKPFIPDFAFLGALTDDDVKTSSSAVQARLAHIEYGNDLVNILHKYGGKSRFKQAIGQIKLDWIESRNKRLMSRAVNNAIRKECGWGKVLERRLNCAFHGLMLLDKSSK